MYDYLIAEEGDHAEAIARHNAAVAERAQALSDSAYGWAEEVAAYRRANPTDCPKWGEIRNYLVGLRVCQANLGAYNEALVGLGYAPVVALETADD